MLLVGAGLLTRSFTRLVAQDPGFRTDHLLTVNIALPSSRYPNDTVRTAFFDRATQAIASVPGVTAAGATSVMPFTNNWSTSSFNVEGHVENANMPWGDIRLVTRVSLRHRRAVAQGSAVHRPGRRQRPRS
jgi:hypothetical protein